MDLSYTNDVPGPNGAACTVQGVNGLAAWRTAFYSVSYGMEIDTDFVSTTSFFYDNAYPNLGQSFTSSMDTIDVPVEFYVAYFLQGATDIYGWVHLEYDGLTLNLLDNAAENDGVGIIAGQYQQVPEPATILLFGLGGFSAWLLRRNKATKI